MSFIVLALVILVIVSVLTVHFVSSNDKSHFVARRRLALLQNSSPKAPSIVTAFPTKRETYEMSLLSKQVYAFRKFAPIEEEEEEKRDVNCTVIRHMIAPQIECLSYHHDVKQGTQVWIVVVHKPLDYPPSPDASNSSSSSSSSWYTTSDRKKQQQTPSFYPYVAVVFAGTDDFRSSLVDGDIYLKPFIPLEEASQQHHSFYQKKAKVHAGFENELFSNGIYTSIKDTLLEHYYRQRRHEKNYNNIPLYTTGHSLGAATAILLGMALALEYNMTTTTSKQPLFWNQNIKSITFGCPKMGNQEFHQVVGTNALLQKRLHIFRYVMKDDIVPRLPPTPLFCHVGHTLQVISFPNDDDTPSVYPPISNHMSKTKKKHNNDTSIIQVKAYYRHVGNVTLDYAGVPWYWDSKSFLWVPSSIHNHLMVVYSGFAKILMNTTVPSTFFAFRGHKHDKNRLRYYTAKDKPVVKDFERIKGNDDNKTDNDDDDYYWNPPDDYIQGVEIKY